jgi:NAD(P)-dependent dehydrogenase (short-subunit alcohol dehydrogenase family)
MSFCDLTNKTVLITGASSGIGRQAAISISQLGGKVFITGRDSQKLEETFGMLHGNGHLMQSADLVDEADRKELISILPELDGLVHCAGIVGPTPAKFIREEEINKMFNINYRVPVLLTASILQRKKMNKGGSIVLMSSVVTQHPYFGGALYAGSKGAIEAYTKTLALELVDRQIRVNCLSPGLVNTPLITDPAKEDNPEIVEDSLNKYIAKYPMGVGEAADVANAIVFLLSDQSRWISGTNIPMGAVVR